jgi:hypothetical protein
MDYEMGRICLRSVIDLRLIMRWVQFLANETRTGSKLNRVLICLVEYTAGCTLDMRLIYLVRCWIVIHMNRTVREFVIR